MESPELNTALTDLIGHLEVSTTKEQKEFTRLSKSLSETSFDKDRYLPVKKRYSYEESDLFFENRVSKERRKIIDTVVKTRATKEKETRFKVFRREVPVRDNLLPGSVADWAVGAKVDHAIGPFKGKDGRQFWYDFFPLEKFVALYVQGVSDPVLLFRARTEGRININVPIKVRAVKIYNLVQGSIWINSKFLAPNAPDGTYTGLTISGGKITLSNLPKLTGKKLTVSARTSITVSLNLDQPEVVDADTESPYGKNARKINLQLPEHLTFHFSGHGRSIDKVGSASWKVYGQALKFGWNDSVQTTYNPLIQRIFFPFKPSSQEVVVQENASEFNFLSGQAAIHSSGWVLPVSTIDVSQPLAAAGIGEVFIQCKEGLTNRWHGLKGGGYNLNAPGLLVGPGQILLADFAAGNTHASQSLQLWKDEQNKFGSKVNLTFAGKTAFFYVSNANGNELLMTFANADFQIDRPVKVNGDPTAVRSLNSLLVIAVSKTAKLIYLFDDNLILDDAQINNEDPIVPERMALALTNALFKVTQPNGCLLFGSLSENLEKVEKGVLLLAFGMYAYIPTLPDPYAANLCFLRGLLRERDKDVTVGTTASGQQLTASLFCLIAWDVPTDDKQYDKVNVSFHFAPLANQFSGIFLDRTGKEIECRVPSSTPSKRVKTHAVSNNGAKSDRFTDSDGPSSQLNALNVADFFNGVSESASVIGPVGGGDTLATHRSSAAASELDDPLPDYGAQWDKDTFHHNKDLFALLDVSTNADLFGISFDWLTRRDFGVSTRVDPTTGEALADFFPIQASGMDVVSAGANVKAFAVPQISWEPTFNLTPAIELGDPNFGFNYYPDDGGALRILNNSREKVVLAPKPINTFLTEKLDNEDDFFARCFFTLPFGMKAVAHLQKKYDSGNGNTRRGGILKLGSEEYGDLKGATQLRMIGGEAQAKVESDMFAGRTVQLANILDLDGQPPSTPKSTLGDSVTRIFNDSEFSPSGTSFILQRGVPLERIDLSGYGASAFSNWLNPKAAIAEVSQAKFDIMIGRCAHEIIQVKSIMYPWAIKVVRTITLFRVGSGYVYRYDTGWRPESNGQFNFRYFIKQDTNNDGKLESIEQSAEFQIHPGIVTGLFNITNIKETNEVADFKSTVIPEFLVDESTGEGEKNNANVSKDVLLRPVFFDADIEIENPVSGFQEKEVSVKDQLGNTHKTAKKLVASKRILGFVQLGPKGVPITSDVLAELVFKHASIGGPIDCEVNLVESAQKMRLSRFDFNNSFGANGSEKIFSVAGKGNVLLPKEGSWSMVRHERGTGDVTPAPTDLSVPVIREGMVIKNGETVKIEKSIDQVLTRIAEPTELLRQPNDTTINYGFLQSTDTQKALFLTPSFKNGQKKLLSKTTPLFVDAFRIVNSKGIFPNIGDAETNLGEAIPLEIAGTPFDKINLQDAGKDVFEFMDVQDTIDNAKQQGFKLLKKTADNFFELPTSFDLINIDDNFRLYIEYEGKGEKAKLDFDIDSVKKSWKGKMENISLVLDLAGIQRLMTISGNWDSENGKEATYPEPDLKFSPELQPLVDLLEILQSLQTGDYGDAVGKGLKLAMSNKAGSWEYKFEASKEIPVLRFPFPDALYNDPNAPFKLECGLKISAYFNAALKVTTDANELLPSAGGSLGFYARLSVMCVSISAATVYAIGQAEVTIAADTKIGPSLRMKFGFGAQIVVGLPVAGNVSILFVVGAEIFIAEGEVEVSAFLLFEGHAEILGGIVSITIRIEARGTYTKKAIGEGTRTDLECQVTFGLDISIAFIINISFTESWQEQRQIA